MALEPRMMREEPPRRMGVFGLYGVDITLGATDTLTVWRGTLRLPRTKCPSSQTRYISMLVLRGMDG